jgi:hypothetical protein
LVHCISAILPAVLMLAGYAIGLPIRKRPRCASALRAKPVAMSFTIPDRFAYTIELVRLHLLRHRQYRSLLMEVMGLHVPGSALSTYTPLEMPANG